MDRNHEVVKPGADAAKTLEDPTYARDSLSDNVDSDYPSEGSDRAISANEPDDSAFAFKIKLTIACVAFVVGFAFCFIELGGDRKINQTLAIAIWMAGLWLTEIIPLVVTAFMPLFLFPLFGINSGAAVAANYANNTIFLFVSGFMIGLTLERWNLHRRFSLKITGACGGKPGFLLLGMMGSTFLLSMFVSNTATALMMVPNAVSVVESLERTSHPENLPHVKKFGIALLLGIAYAANVGGMATVVGTPPNLVFQAQFTKIFPDGDELTFAEWLGFAFPLSFVCFVLIWVYLKFLYLRGFQGEAAPVDFFQKEYLALGPWTYEQMAVALSFTLMALLWIFRADMNLGSVTINGWSNIFPQPSYIADATVGMAINVFLFMCPARSANLPENQKPAPEAADQSSHNDVSPVHAKFDTTLLDWSTANKMPYDIMFLFGGGFALADGFLDSGLSAFLGDKLASLSVSIGAQILLLGLVIIWLTELTSNTATANIMIPIAASLAIGSGGSPYAFMAAAAFACSCAFCLPVATPPNMVAFSSGHLPLIEMNKAGVLLNILCTFLVYACAMVLVPAVTGVGVDEFPAWAESSSSESS
eukprot:Nitzschia sp. Nitz4//NODE_389_length_21930_cov_67.393920//12226//13995//NITZ4_additional_000050-RA//-1//CDS//3329531874//1117//frame0